MKLINSPTRIQKLISETKRKGKKIAFVPTMGALHEGHLSLIRAGRKKGDILVVSIFVNPTQFSPKEDYKKYPRPFTKDKRLAEKCGVDILFHPKPEEMYPKGYSTYVTEEKLSKLMCGKSRPNHFRGVTTVVLKLFNIVQPDIALFGQKDYQQALIIKRMVKDLNLPIKIEVLPIIREKDGLAISSRNRYLSKQEREKIKDKIKLDYLVVVDKDTLEPINQIKKGKTLIAIAARVGKTRLIDNTLR